MGDTAQGTFPHTGTRDVRSAGSRAGLLHAVGSSRRRGVVVALESGELPIPERQHVCLMIDKRAAGVPNRCLGVHQGYHLVVLGDELSWLERRVVESRCRPPNQPRTASLPLNVPAFGSSSGSPGFTHWMSSAITSASAAMSARPKASYALWVRRVFSSADTGTPFR